MNQILITEGKIDQAILQKLLPDSLLEQTKFVVSNGYSSAISMAKSIAIHKAQPIVIVLDADTLEHSRAEEKKEEIEFIFKNLGKAEQVSVFLFEPEIEAIFFESNTVHQKFAHLLEQTPCVYHEQLRSLKKHPEFINQLDEADINALRTETSLKSLIALCTQHLM